MASILYSDEEPASDGPQESGYSTNSNTSSALCIINKNMEKSNLKKIIERDSATSESNSKPGFIRPGKPKTVLSKRPPSNKRNNNRNDFYNQIINNKNVIESDAESVASNNSRNSRFSRSNGNKRCNHHKRRRQPYQQPYQQPPPQINPVRVGPPSIFDNAPIIHLGIRDYNELLHFDQCLKNHYWNKVNGCENSLPIHQRPFIADQQQLQQVDHYNVYRKKSAVKHSDVAGTTISTTVVSSQYVQRSGGGDDIRSNGVWIRSVKKETEDSQPIVDISECESVRATPLCGELASLSVKNPQDIIDLVSDDEMSDDEGEDIVTLN